MHKFFPSFSDFYHNFPRGISTLTGNSLDNVLTDNSGNDCLNGGSMDDLLISGGGADTIHLDNSAFVGIGALGAARLALGASATTAAHRVVYDQAQGEIHYDADGSGAGAQVLFARVTAGTALTDLDFLVI